MKKKEERILLHEMLNVRSARIDTYFFNLTSTPSAAAPYCEAHCKRMCAGSQRNDRFTLARASYRTDSMRNLGVADFSCDIGVELGRVHAN